MVFERLIAQVFSKFAKESRQKNGYFTVRLTLSVETPPPILPLPFFRVCLTFDYDYMCNETDFTQEKKSSNF